MLKQKAILFLKTVCHYRWGRPLNEASRQAGIHCFHNVGLGVSLVLVLLWLVVGCFLKIFTYFFLWGGDWQQKGITLMTHSKTSVRYT